jgi:hypothetical protein
MQPSESSTEFIPLPDRDDDWMGQQQEDPGETETIEEEKEKSSSDND